METVYISVKEIDKFSANYKPERTERAFNEDFSVDYFICPSCNNKVSITHWEDVRGKWPKVNQQCENCGKQWDILK